MPLIDMLGKRWEQLSPISGCFPIPPQRVYNRNVLFRPMAESIRLETENPPEADKFKPPAMRVVVDSMENSDIERRKGILAEY